MKDFKDVMADNESTIKEILTETAKWMRFLSIVGLVGELFVFGVGVLMIFSDRGDVNGIPSIWMGVIYIVVAIISLFPLIYLNGCSQSITEAYKEPNMEKLLNAVKYNKRFWKLYGIFVLIYLVIIALLILFGLFWGCIR
ncbi:MAG: hypothetical protein KBT04_05495 [Bacteroidales bacterium]|nr:hypothetical protein [Candidatus Colimorpha onthohippi]